MQEENSTIENKIKDIINSSSDMNLILYNLGNLLQTLKH